MIVICQDTSAIVLAFAALNVEVLRLVFDELCILLTGRHTRLDDDTSASNHCRASAQVAPPVIVFSSASFRSNSAPCDTMATIGSKTNAPVGSMRWALAEREQADQFLSQESEEFTFAARNEMEWLNEHMADIFNRSHLYVQTLSGDSLATNT